MKERIAVIGLGYVGLPIALAFAKKHEGTIGFDLNAEGVENLRRGVDVTREVENDVLAGTSLEATTDPQRLQTPRSSWLPCLRPSTAPSARPGAVTWSQVRPLGAHCAPGTFRFEVASKGRHGGYLRSRSKSVRAQARQDLFSATRRRHQQGESRAFVREEHQIRFRRGPRRWSASLAFTVRGRAGVYRAPSIAWRSAKAVENVQRFDTRH